MEKELNPMSFESSHGTLLVNEDGAIHPDSDTEDWLGTISKVDIEELDNYYALQGIEGKCEGGDVMDFGYWDKKGKYFEPEKDWRLNVFHSRELSRAQARRIVNKSFEWIKINRV